MRQTLFRIWLDQPWALWTDNGIGEVPLLGACWVWLICGAAYLLAHLARRDVKILRDPITWLTWGVGVLGLSLAPALGILPSWIPVFGYGTMVLIGFATAFWFTYSRARAIGMDPEIVVDSAFWLLLSGIIGGRVAYLIQYGQHVFRNVNSLGEALFAAVNLTQGGLVLIGGLLGGGVGFLAFCRMRKLNALAFADLLVPAIFIGIGFGRIGCLLNGCCFGDACELPWGITFPQGSVTFEILAERGFVDPQAPETMPLHPTQIYSSINGFILALVTGTYFWYRRRPGDVFAMGCILYPITRILMELLRADEMGQLGTGLTISQFYSLGILAFGVVLLCTGHLRQQGATSGKGDATSPPPTAVKPAAHT